MGAGANGGEEGAIGNRQWAMGKRGRVFGGGWFLLCPLARIKAGHPVPRVFELTEPVDEVVDRGLPGLEVFGLFPEMTEFGLFVVADFE